MVGTCLPGARRARALRHPVRDLRPAPREGRRAQGEPEENADQRPEDARLGLEAGGDPGVREQTGAVPRDEGTARGDCEVRGPDPVGRLLQAGARPAVPPAPRSRVEDAEGRVKSPPRDQHAGGGGPPEAGERDRGGLLEDEGEGRRPREGRVPDGARNRPPEARVIMFPIARFRVEDRSMEPTLSPGAFVLVNRLSYKLHPPARGDLVVLRDPQVPSRFLVKRIADLSVSGAYVVGDNELQSRDSRTIGPVPRDVIVGPVLRTAKP